MSASIVAPRRVDCVANSALPKRCASTGHVGFRSGRRVSVRLQHPRRTRALGDQPVFSLAKMVVANALSAIEKALAHKDLQVLQTPLCGYRTFSNLLDATPWEHLHPTMPHQVCEPPKLRTALYAASSRSPRRLRRPTDSPHAHRLPASTLRHTRTGDSQRA